MKHFRYMKTGGKMKRNLFLLFTFNFLLFAVLLLGCGGGGPGAPGNSGTEDTGVKLEATVTPTYLGSSTYSIDVFQDICDAGPPPTYEEFTDHNAALLVRARIINPNTTFLPGNLYIEKYTILYRRSTDSVGAPPILSDTRFKTMIIPAPTPGTEPVLQDTVILIDLLRKEQYATDVLSGQYNYGLAYINNYTATYTFEGKNEYGTKFKFQTQTDFQIGWFDYCQ